MKIFTAGDKVIIQGRKYPGVVINLNGSKAMVRTDDNRTLVVDTEKLDLYQMVDKIKNIMT